MESIGWGVFKEGTFTMLYIKQDFFHGKAA